MRQLKFDKDGFLLPQKISSEVNNEKKTEKAIKEVELEKEIIQGLNVLAPGDRNIKALTIYCNPNYKRGSDQSISKLIMAILEKLIDQSSVIKEKSPKGSVIFSLSNKKNIQKKGV